jgi:hypothetical protein
MKRFSNKAGKSKEFPEIDKFLEEIKTVCEKHGMSISHEDGHGGFEIEDYDEYNIEWLFAAADNRRTPTMKPTPTYRILAALTEWGYNRRLAKRP